MRITAPMVYLLASEVEVSWLLDITAFRANLRSLLCLTRARWKKFPAKRQFLKSNRGGIFWEVSRSKGMDLRIFSLEYRRGLGRLNLGFCWKETSEKFSKRSCHISLGEGQKILSIRRTHGVVSFHRIHLLRLSLTHHGDLWNHTVAGPAARPRPRKP